MNLASALRSAAGVQQAEIRRRARAMVRGLMLLMIVAVLAVCALIFVMVGAYHSLSETLPNWQAGGLVALGALAACLLLLAIVALGGRRTRRTPPRRRGSTESSMETGAEFADAAREFLGDHRPTGVDLTIAAFVVGLLSSRRRRRDDD